MTAQRKYRQNGTDRSHGGKLSGINSGTPSLDGTFPWHVRQLKLFRVNLARTEHYLWEDIFKSPHISPHNNLQTQSKQTRGRHVFELWIQEKCKSTKRKFTSQLAPGFRFSTKTPSWSLVTFACFVDLICHGKEFPHCYSTCLLTYMWPHPAVASSSDHCWLLILLIINGGLPLSDKEGLTGTSEPCLFCGASVCHQTGQICWNL